MVSRSVLRTYHLNSPVNDIKWSPDSKLVAVAKGTDIVLYCSPNIVKDVNPFHIVRILHGPYEDVTSLDWSNDSLSLVAGSRDGTTRVYQCETPENENSDEKMEDGSFRSFHLAWSRRNVKMCSLGGASGPVVAAFFNNGSQLSDSPLDVYVVTSNGHVFVWKKNDDFREVELKNGKTIQALNYSKQMRYGYKASKKVKEETDMDVDDKNDTVYAAGNSYITTACYHPKTKLLVGGFSDGSIFINEMPTFTLIHCLSVTEHCLSSVKFNESGDWLAIASKHGQLAVWEWRSEMFVLKQQGHFDAATAVAISPDGRFLASGGADAKIKLWELANGHCFVTFGEHSAGIVGLAWTQSAKAVLSASLDGTVRAFDTTRYRNFRTYTTPKATQLTCLAVDDSGELVAAGASDSFEVFMWSISTGQLLETFCGHQSPISNVVFLPVPRSGMLVSSSWDGHVRFWAVTEADSATEGGGTRDAVKLSSDVLTLATRPDGFCVAAATLDCQIAIIETETGRQLGTIEAKHDVGSGRQVGDLITAKQRGDAGGQYFSCLRYSPDGEFLLAAGLSRFICIYSVKDPGEEVLVRRIQLSLNLSIDGNQRILSRKHMSEQGYLNRSKLDFGDDADDNMRLPGVKKYDMTTRKFDHQIQVWSLDFNAGGDNFVAGSSEGLLVYSLHSDLSFDPVDLDPDLTVGKVESLIKGGDLSRAILMALKLKNRDLIAKAIENIKYDHVQLVASTLPASVVPDLIAFVASRIDSGEHASSLLEVYLRWADALLLNNVTKFSSGTTHSKNDKLAPALTLLQRAVTNRSRTLGQV